MPRQNAEPALSRGASTDHPFLAGALAGCIEICCTFPFEYTKTQLQLQPKNAPKFGSMADVARFTLRTHGFAGFYRGLTSWLVFAAPRLGVRFWTFEHAKDAIYARNGGKSSGNTLFAGIVAGATEAATFQTPMLAIQCKMNHDMTLAKPQFNGFLDATRQIIRTEGFVGGMYRGVAPNIVKSSMTRSIRFACYADICDWFRRSQGLQENGALGTLSMMAAGSLAGAVSVVITHPVDTVRVNIQSLQGDGYNGMVDCGRQIWKAKGIRGLFVGIGPRTMRVCVNGALVFTIYGHLCNLLDDNLPPGLPF